MLICPPFLRQVRGPGGGGGGGGGDEGRISRDQYTEDGRRKLMNDDMFSTLSTLDLRVYHIPGGATWYQPCPYVCVQK